jgi:hypothetical protein
VSYDDDDREPCPFCHWPLPTNSDCAWCVAVAANDLNENGAYSQLDPEASEQTKREGIRNVRRGTDPDWRARCEEVVRCVALDKPYFNSNHIWERIEKPREPRALGPVMQWAKKQGFCEQLGTDISQIPTQHKGYVGSYRSLIYESET